jgi:integrase
LCRTFEVKGRHKWHGSAASGDLGSSSTGRRRRFISRGASCAPSNGRRRRRACRSRRGYAGPSSPRSRTPQGGRLDERERGSGSLRLRGTIWWLRYFHNGKLVEESSKTSDEREAKKRLRNKLKTADTPLYVAPTAQKVTFKDLCDLLRRNPARKGNRSHIEQRLAHLARVFARRRALSITAEDVEQYLDDRIASGAAVATANRDASELRHAFRLAVEKDLLPKAPAITLRPEDNAREDFVEVADLDALLEALRQQEPVIADCTEFGFSTCLRRGNVLGLEWTRLQLEVEGDHVVGGELRLPGTATKNKKPLTGRLLAIVDRRWQARVLACPYVFHRAGHPVVEFRKAWRTATKAIGQPDLTFHGLRRSGARALRRLGVDQITIMRLGGWKTDAMFQRYSIVDSSDLTEAQQKLDAKRAAPGPRKVVAIRRGSVS